MTRSMGITKNDSHAKELWGAAYDDIPKSVFATVAWHLANLCSDRADTPGAALERFISEIEVLRDNEMIPKPQAIAALRKLDA
jgi:hypothetical protein